MLHISNRPALTNFFEENQELTTYELASILRIAPSTVREWKRACNIMLDIPIGIPDSFKFKKPIRKVKKVKEKWNTKEWFEEQYVTKGLGCYTIAKMIERSMPLVHKKLRKFGVPIRTHEEAVSSKHKCCTKEWVEEFYINRRLPLERCSEIAGISTYSMYYWLIKHDIEIRDIYEA